MESIAEYLYNKGTTSNSIERLTQVIDGLKIIAKWYLKETAPSESETKAYLIIPLLRALGWTPQKMALEWKNIDIALFSKLPRTVKNLITLTEAKKTIRLPMGRRADGLYIKAGLADDKAALLVVIGVNQEGAKKLLAMMKGYRESAKSWKEVLRDLKSRGLEDTRLIIGNGALGLWAAVREVYPGAREQHAPTLNIRLQTKLQTKSLKLDEKCAYWMKEPAT